METEPDLIIERADHLTTEQLTENKSDYLIWRSQRSWHGGAGQLRFDAATSNENAFDSSFGVDWSIPGQLTLAGDIATQTISGSNLDSRRLTVSGGFVFCEALDTGVYKLFKFQPGSAGSFFTMSNGTARPYGLASDGKNVYVALGASGVDSGVASGGSSANFSTADVRAISWEKQQLVGAGVKSGTQWRLLAIAAAAGSSELLALPDGFTVPQNAISSTLGFTYFGASSDHVSVVYGWDGAATPKVCLELPEGDQITSLTNYNGQYLLIGARRLVAGGLGLGVLYLATPNSTGFLTAVEIVQLGTASNTIDYAITSMGAHSKHVHFTYVPYGLGMFLPQYTSYGRHIGNLNGVETKGGDVIMWQETHVFSAGPNVYYESGKYVPSGQVVGSLMDWNIDANKIVLRAEAGFTSLPAGTSVQFDYSIDEGVTWNTLTTGFTGDNVASIVGVLAKNIKYRITLSSEATTHALTPTLKKGGFGGWYGDKARSQHVIAIKAHDRMTLRNGSVHPNSGPKLGEAVASRLRTLRQNQSVVTFQPPGWGESHTRSFNVNVRSLETKVTWRPEVGWGRTILATIMEIPGTQTDTWGALAPKTWASLSTIQWGVV